MNTAVRSPIFTWWKVSSNHQRKSLPKLRTTTSLAARLLAEIKIEQKWKRLIEIETELAEEKQRTEPLRTTLKYLECRAYGMSLDVNTQSKQLRYHL